jgi:hypothetical protein
VEPVLKPVPLIIDFHALQPGVNCGKLRRISRIRSVNSFYQQLATIVLTQSAFESAPLERMPNDGMESFFILPKNVPPVNPA